MTTFNKVFKMGVLFFMLVIAVNMTYFSYQSSRLSEYEPELITNDEIHKMAVPGYGYEMQIDEKIFEYISEHFFEMEPPTVLRNNGKYLEVIRYDRTLLARIMGNLRLKYNLRREKFNDRQFPECLNAACFAVLSADKEIVDYQRRQYLAYVNRLKVQQQQRSDIEELADDDNQDKS